MLLDANAAFLPFREGVPVEQEVERLLPGAELAVPSTVRGELERLLARGVPTAGAALTFARRLRSVPARGLGDAAVLDAARRLGASVVTADRELGETLRAAGLAVLGPRDRARLELRPGRGPATGGSRRRSARRPKG